MGFPGGTGGKEPACDAGISGDPGSTLGQEDTRRRVWQPSSVFLTRESHGQRSLAGWSPQGCTELETTEAT